MVRAVVADTLGPIENYALREVAPRPLGPTDVRLAVKATGVGFVDVLVAAGRYQVKPPVPFTPGSECAGIVTEVGGEVAEFRPGQRVIATGWRHLFADAAVVPAGSTWPLPDGYDFREGATFSISYQTAWHGLVDRGQLRAGQSLLVLGAGGATGYAAVEIGRLLGAHVIASASSEPKRAMALAGGANAAVDARAPDWRARVKAANAGRAIDLVFDPVGGGSTEPAFRSLGYAGRHLIVGFPGGVAGFRTNLPLLKEASLIGVNLSAFGAAEPGHARANHQRLLELAAGGSFRPIVARAYPLAEFADAMRDASDGSRAGRIVLTTE